MKIKLLQCAPRVGDVAGNVALVADGIVRARQEQVDLLVFPELMLSGYPPEDLLLQADFLQRIDNAIRHVAELAVGVAVMLGAPCRREDGRLCNALLVFADGRLIFRYDKRHLPNYGVFDERRYFVRGGDQPLLRLGGHLLGVAICEDLWSEDFADAMASCSVDAWISINASPYHIGKRGMREALCRKLACRTGTPVAYLNMIGGQDELVFDGSSFVTGPDGLWMTAKAFRPDALTFDPSMSRSSVAICSSSHDDMADLHQALLMGLRDYVERNGARRVLLGLSGGIDSAVVAALAAEALGASAVLGVLLPSVHSSSHSIRDAMETVRLLGIAHAKLPIMDLVEAASNTLAPLFSSLGCDPAPGICEENLQARARALLLMAISNKTGRMLLTTGNKSELAVGYATLYGDMCGAYAVLKDLYKTQVFALAKWMNERAVARSGRLCIPTHSITKPPSAELAPGQQDSDSLPPYEDLDRMLHGLIERHASVREVASWYGFPREEVARIESMLHANEYKRRQAPPGVKVSVCAFGRERRFPMTHAYRSVSMEEDVE